MRKNHWAELDALGDDARATRIAELNVHHSINVLEQHPAVKHAMEERGLAIHGLIYDLATGQLKVLEKVGNQATDEPVIQGRDRQ